jgi:streptogramin lyase
MWFSESFGDQLGRFDPVHLKFAAPINLHPGDNPWALLIGPDKNVWFTGRSSGKIGTVVNGAVTEFKISGPSGSYPDSIAIGPDGNLWFTESLTFGVGRFNPTTKRFMPRIVLPSNDIPTGIIQGPGGSMWFTDPSYNDAQSRIGVIHPR